MRFKPPKETARDKVYFAYFPKACSSDYGVIWLEKFVKTQDWIPYSKAHRPLSWVMGKWITRCVTPYSEYKKLFPDSDL